MPTINQLPVTDSPENNDLIAIYSSVNGDARKTSLNTLKNFFVPSTSTGSLITQYAAPATGGTITITEVSASTWLVITPLATIAAATITLPLADTCSDHQELTVTSTQEITTLTVSANGSTLVGVPSTITAQTSFTLRFDIVMKTWYKVA